MSGMTTNRHRVRIDGDILLTLDGDIVTIATPRFAPGIFFAHAELLEVHVVPKGEDWILLTGCVTTKGASSLVVRTYDGKALSEPKMVRLED